MDEQHVLRLLKIIEDLVRQMQQLTNVVEKMYAPGFDFPMRAEAIQTPEQNTISPGVKSWAQRRRDLEKRFEKPDERQIDWAEEADRAQKELSGVNIPENKVG